MGILGQYIQFLSRSAEFEIEKKVLSFLPRGESLVYLDLGCDDGAKSLERSQKIGTNNILGVEVVSSRAKEAESKNIKVIKVDLLIIVLIVLPRQKLSNIYQIWITFFPRVSVF